MMSSGSVSHTPSTTSLHPSPSSSSSVMSGIPSSSVSSSLAEIVMSYVWRNRELLAETAYVVVLSSTAITPVISPFVVLKSKPSGSWGLIDHEEILPPKISGSRKTSSRSVVRFRNSSR